MFYLQAVNATQDTNAALSDHKRLSQVDALRGFALFGILVVNIFVFHAPYAYYGEFYGAFTGLERVYLESMIFLFGGKFMFIFSLLFGWGAYVQYQRYGLSFLKKWRVRMLLLVLLGFLHIVFLWWGDILWSYGLLGLLLASMVKWRSGALIGVVVLMSLVFPLATIWCILNGIDPPQAVHPLSLNELTHEYQTAGFIALMKTRWDEWTGFLNHSLMVYIPKQLLAMSLGVLAGKYRLWRSKSPVALWKILVLVIALGAWGVYRYSFFAMFDLEAFPFYRPALIWVNDSFSLLQGVLYVALFQYAWIKGGRTFMAHILENMGRLSLSVYITQSVICAFIFNGFGWGQFGHWNPSTLLISAVIIYLFQAVLVIIYLRYYRRGPLEHLWRLGVDRVVKAIGQG